MQKVGGWLGGWGGGNKLYGIESYIFTSVII